MDPGASQAIYVQDINAAAAAQQQQQQQQPSNFEEEGEEDALSTNPHINLLVLYSR
jgi:hypothetical protein